MVHVRRFLSIHVNEMKALTWKAMFATWNPSPVFEAVAIFAEGLAMSSDKSCSKEIDGENDFALAKAEGNRTAHMEEHAAVASPEI